MAGAIPVALRRAFLGIDLRKIFTPKILILTAVILIVGYLALVPLAYLLWGTFLGEDGLTLQHFWDAYAEETYGLGRMASNSFLYAFGATLIAVPVGTGLAYLYVRTDVPFRSLVFAASLVPLIIPGILHTVAWILLGSPRIGLINRALRPVLGGPLLDIFSLPGMALVEGLHLSPLVFLLMVAAFKSMDPALEESAMLSGASRMTVLRKITLPMVKPALYASILIMIVRGLESFEVPALLGIPGGIWVFTSRIWRVLSTFPVKYGQAGAYSISLLLITSIGVYLQTRLSRRGRRFQTVTGKGFRPHPIELGKWRWPAAGLGGLYFFVAVVLPVFVLLYTSTQPFYTLPSWETLGNMTLDNYRFVFEYPQATRAFRNSLLLGIGTATGVMFMMAIASWIVVRTKLAGRWMIDNLSFVPLVIPGLVMGVALLFVYLRFPIPIYGTIWILFIAYFTRYMPYGMRYSTASMYQISRELEESAQTSGASWWSQFRKVTLPLLMPGLVAGWIYIVMVSVRELSSSILLYSPGSEVLSIVIWEQWENGQFTELTALGVLMIVMLVVLVSVGAKLGAKVGVKAD